MSVEIESTYEFSDNNVWGGLCPISASDVEKLAEGDRRVICTLNNSIRFHAALMPNGSGDFFVLINKQRAKKLGLLPSQPLTIVLEKDNSKYGMEMPIEFEELLAQDDEAQQVFEKISPGKQRNLIHIVSVPKSSDIRLRKALSIVNYIKSTGGEIDFKELNRALSLNR